MYEFIARRERERVFRLLRHGSICGCGRCIVGTGKGACTARMVRRGYVKDDDSVRGGFLSISADRVRSTAYGMRNQRSVATDDGEPKDSNRLRKSSQLFCGADD